MTLHAPILYHLKDKQAVVESVDFNPEFRDHLFFIHLNKKQNSREGIRQYRNQSFDRPRLIQQVSAITKQLLVSTSLLEFQELLNQHENLISENLKIPTVKSEKFPEYSGSIKSLGAWGGDFILATGNQDTPNYFKQKGYHTIIKYSVMIL